MPVHNELYELAVRAARDLYSDRSVSTATIKASLQALQDEIDVMTDMLPSEENDTNATKNNG